MLRKTIATITAAAAALLVVGVAWASGGDATSTSVTSEGATSTSLDDRSSTSVPAASRTPTTDESPSSTIGVTSSTSTTVEDRDDRGDDDRGEDRGRDDREHDDHTTATTITPTTSTSIGSSSSTSRDDSAGRVPPDARTTHDIPGVGQVTIEVIGGRLTLVDVSAPGWRIELDEVESDRIEIEFESGDGEARFEARVRGDRVEVKIEVDTD